MYIYVHTTTLLNSSYNGWSRDTLVETMYRMVEAAVAPLLQKRFTREAVQSQRTLQGAVAKVLATPAGPRQLYPSQ